MADQYNWHALEITQVLEQLESSPSGLTEHQALEKLEEFGPNTLEKKKKTSAWKLFAEQFKSFLIIILLVAVALSAVLGETTDAILIFVIVLFASGLSFIQEYRAEKAMEALSEMAAPRASVMRGSREVELASDRLVPGDVIILRTGDRIPADGRLIESVNFKTDEAALTGESLPVSKSTHPVGAGAAIGDRKNMVFTGTAAVYGRAKAVVTSTGMRTEFGKIAEMLLKVKPEKTPLQINLDRIGKYIGIGALVLSFMLAAIGVARGREILEMIIWGVSLAVAAVPEALPAVVVISLALGIRRMVKRHALIRRLPAVETLGSTTYICSDKTGTLTQDRMTVRSLYIDGRLVEVTGTGYQPKGSFLLDGTDISGLPGLKTLLTIGALCNDTALVENDGDWNVQGDPTEGALVVVAAKHGIDQKNLADLYPRVGEIPFSSETKRMTTLHELPGGVIAYSKGAPEVILDSCDYILLDGAERELTREDKENILAENRAMANRALRVLGLAYKKLDANDAARAEKSMVFTGMAGMIDPPRDEVKQAIGLCDRAGIRSVMITGDHKLTATAIARELGLLKKGVAFTGAELDTMTDREFDELVETIEVYARVSPAHKLRVVEALAKKKHVVAMTGDGINDAPALKKADIGIAMGITGTDVTKEAADMILTDDNFASIVAAVEEGRIIFGNIKKYLMYLLSSNIGEILLMAGAILLGPAIGLPAGAIPLIAVQLLFVNLVTDGLPAIALSIDPPEPGIMAQKPRPRGEGIFTRPVIILMLSGGIWSFMVNLAIFTWAVDSGKSMLEAQTMTFISLILIQFFKAYNFRSDKYSAFKIGFFANKWLNLAVLSQAILLIFIVYVPAMQEAFHTYPLGTVDWVIIGVASLSIFPVLEVVKAILRRKTKQREAENL